MLLIRKSLLLLTVYLMLYSVSRAVEYDVQAGRTAWHYEEYAKDVSGFSGYLPSKAAGNGTLLKLRLSSERDRDWFFGLSASLMDSASWANEKWNTSQTNALSIKQEDVRLDAQYRMFGARFGLWLAQRQQTQERRDFYVNNVYIPVAGEPIAEKITSDWFGLSLTVEAGNMNQFEARIAAAKPLNVKVTNPLFKNPFTKSDGYRAGIHLCFALLPKQESGGGLNITFSHEYQELGGEKTAANGFWPYNRWQMTAVGLMYAW